MQACVLGIREGESLECKAKRLRTPSSPPEAADAGSQAADRKEAEVLKLLQRDLHLSLEDAQRVLHTPDVAGELIRLHDQGIQLSEDDPLVCLLMERADEVCLHYLNSGNYGLPPHIPGSMPWPGGAPPAVGAPLPPNVVAAPDRALGRFLALQPGLTDVSNGKLAVFRGSLEDFERARRAVLNAVQFRRYDNATANALNRPAEDSLVQFISYSTITSAPTTLFTFNLA